MPNLTKVKSLQEKEDIESRKVVELKEFPLSRTASAIFYKTKRKNTLSSYDVDHGYLFFFAMTLCLASDVQVGWAFGENLLVGYILSEKMGYEKTGNFTAYTALTMAGPLGLAIGSFLASTLIRKLGGIRQTIIILNFLGMFVNSTKLFLSMPAILFGRVSFGIIAAVC